MGRYIDRQDIEDVCGAANVAAWSNLDNDAAADGEARVLRAIAWAEEWIDARFTGSRYAVPLRTAGGESPTQVRDWAAWLAGWWLQSPREPDPQRRAAHLQVVEHQVELVLRGQVQLPANLASPGGDAPAVV
jgi:hypothetical protein